MATTTKPRIAESKHTYETLDYSGLNMFALTSAVVLLFTFIFMPWVGARLTDNGARLMSDVLYGAIGVNETVLITIIPLMALLAGGLALWGIVRPDYGQISMRLTVIPGVVGLTYYAVIFLGIVEESPVKKTGPGAGFWVSLFCLLGFILPIGLGHPRVHGRLTNSSSTLGSHLSRALRT